MSFKSKFIEKAKQALEEKVVKFLMEELKSRLDKIDRSNVSEDEIIATYEDIMQEYCNAREHCQEKAEKIVEDLMNEE